MSNQVKNDDRMFCHLTSFVSIHAIEKKVKSLSHVGLFATPWIVACQAPPSRESSRHVYWSGLPLPSPGDLPDPGIEPGSPAFPGLLNSRQTL